MLAADAKRPLAGCLRMLLAEPRSLKGRVRRKQTVRLGNEALFCFGVCIEHRLPVDYLPKLSDGRGPPLNVDQSCAPHAASGASFIKLRADAPAGRHHAHVSVGPVMPNPTSGTNRLPPVRRTSLPGRLGS